MPKHRVERVLPYTAEQLFDLAADVERYPEFLPSWVAARVVRRERETYETDQIVRFGPIRQRFFSRTVLSRPERIDVTSTSRSFRRFDLTWTFDPVPEGGCRVVLAAEIEFRRAVLDLLFDQALAGMLDKIILAFERRLFHMYGAPQESSPTST